MRAHRGVALAGVLAGLFLVGTVANAATITVTKRESAVGSVGVTITSPSAVDFAAGLFKLTTDQNELVYAFCIDVFRYAGPSPEVYPHTYSVVDPLAEAGDATPGALPVDYPLSLTQLKQINWLYLAAVGELPGLTAVRSAAYQFAIWQVAYAGAPFAATTSPDVTTAYAGIMALLGMADLTNVATPVGLVREGYQTLVVGRTVPVPEPALLGLLALGLFGLAARARRRTR